MDKLSDYFAILRLIETARSGNHPKAGKLYETLDTGIFNQSLNTGMLRGSGGASGGPSKGVPYKRGPSEGISSNKRNPKKPGLEYRADGGPIMAEVEQDPKFLEALERQRLRKQAFDNEFAIEVAAQSNYAADIDPSISRYHGLPNAAPGYDGVRGFYVYPSEEYPEGTFLDDYAEHVFYETKNGDPASLTIIPEAGMVNTIDRHANPQTIAHEYRHRQFPQLNERQNRVADLLTALDERQLFSRLRSSRVKEITTGSEGLDDFRYSLRFERDNPGYGVGSQIFGEEWELGARSTRQGTHDYKDEYIRARIEESPAIKLLNQYEELKEYNEDLPEQNQERTEERQERESQAAVKNYAMGGGVGSMVPVARNMFRGYDDVQRGVGAYAPYIRRA